MDTKYIRIDAIHIAKTYAGVLEGLPSTEETLEHARALAKTLWGPRATMLVPPATRTTLTRDLRRQVSPGEMELQRCPEWTIIAWLNAPSMDKSNDGSELVVIWFQDEIPYEIPGELLHDFGCGTWEKHASDWQI
jgi:hypothetical protein